ncbi:MAG: FAD-binding oxidoreductase [Planctomycetes bacterium]|nr:FAD-binding oxidoreductase [Planctomycetota bacterium]
MNENKVALKEISSVDLQTQGKFRWSQPDRYKSLLSNNKTAIIPQGSALSYVANSFSNDSLTINMKRFDRILFFDTTQKKITVEAGITLNKLYFFLNKYNLFLPIQPGYPGITIGGCIAANIHGKNQYNEGLFENCIEEILLFHPKHGELIISKQQNQEIFDLTIGGFGLTGIIIWAKLRLSLLEENSVNITHEPVDSLYDTATKLQKLSSSYAFLYSWNDLSPNSKYKGRGFIVKGLFTNSPKNKFLLIPEKDLFYPMKFNLFTKQTISIINQIYYFLNSNKTEKVPLYEALFPFVKKRSYYSLFGKTGFWEYQVLIPHNYAEEFCDLFSKLACQNKASISLATCKIFRGSQKYLNFNGEGIVFTFDFLANPSSLELMRQLDKKLSDFNGIINLNKDSRINHETVSLIYPEFELFHKRLRQFDPQRFFQSDFSKRLKL